MLGCAPFLPFVFRLSGVRHFWKIMQIRRNGGLIFLFRTTNPKFVKFRVILENSSNSNKSYFYGKKSKSNEMSLKCVTVSILYHRTYRCRICKLGMSSGEEDLLLREVKIGITYFWYYFERATIKSWREATRRFHTADVHKNKAKIRDNEYVVSDARLLNLYARRLFKLFLMASHEMPRP